MCFWLFNCLSCLLGVKTRKEKEIPAFGFVCVVVFFEAANWFWSVVYEMMDNQVRLGKMEVGDTAQGM